MRLRKLPPLVAILTLSSFFLCGCGGARTSGGGVGVGSSSSDSSSKDGHSTHRQYSHSLDTGSSVSYGSKPVVASVASASASSGSSSYGSGESPGSRGNNGFGSQSSVEYGGAAEGTGNFASLFPGSPSSGGYPSSSSSSGGYPSSSSGGYPASVGHIPSPSPSSPIHSNNNIPGQHPPIDTSQPHGPPYTYYYQHYPTGAVAGGGSSATGGWSGGGVEGHEEGGHGSPFGDFGGAGGGGIAGVGGIAALKGIGIIAAAAKGLLAIKPFLILGLLFLIAIPVLLLFLPIPIITVTGTTAMQPGGRSGRQVTRGDPSVISYLTELSQRVLTSEECLERFMCKLPKAPEPYQKKAKSLWDSYGETMVKPKFSRVARGIEAYFDSVKEKNRVFKCNQRFQCSNKFL